MGKGFHKLRILCDEVSPSIANESFMNIVTADQGNKIPKPFRIIEKIIIYNLNIWACDALELFYHQRKVSLIISAIVQRSSVAERAVMGTGGTCLQKGHRMNIQIAVRGQITFHMAPVRNGKTVDIKVLYRIFLPSLTGMITETVNIFKGFLLQYVQNRKDIIRAADKVNVRFKKTLRILLCVGATHQSENIGIKCLCPTGIVLDSVFLCNISGDCHCFRVVFIKEIFKGMGI